MKSIGDHIREYLNAHLDDEGRPMTPTEFARLVTKTGKATTSRQVIKGLLDNDGRIPRRDVLVGIATVLEKSVDVLLDQTPPVTSPLPTSATVHAFPSPEAALAYLGRLIAAQHPSRRKAIGALLATYAENPKANADSAQAILMMLSPRPKVPPDDKRPPQKPTKKVRSR